MNWIDLSGLGPDPGNGVSVGGEFEGPKNCKAPDSSNKNWWIIKKPPPYNGGSPPPDKIKYWKLTNYISGPRDNWFSDSLKGLYGNIRQWAGDGRGGTGGQKYNPVGPGGIAGGIRNCSAVRPDVLWPSSNLGVAE